MSTSARDKVRYLRRLSAVKETLLTPDMQNVGLRAAILENDGVDFIRVGITGQPLAEWRPASQIMTVSGDPVIYPGTSESEFIRSVRMAAMAISLDRARRPRPSVPDYPKHIANAVLKSFHGAAEMLGIAGDWPEWSLVAIKAKALSSDGLDALILKLVVALVDNLLEAGEEIPWSDIETAFSDAIYDIQRVYDAIAALDTGEGS